jgi:hypothetical protein
MQRLAIRLAGPLIPLALVSQLLLPGYLEDRVADRLTAHGGSATVDLDAIPAATLLLGHGRGLDIRARGLNVDLSREGDDVFKQLDKFGRATVSVQQSRAGPFAIQGFFLSRRADHEYLMVLQADAAPADVARYAGGRLGGGFGSALAGLAAGTLGTASGRLIPVNARVVVDTRGDAPRALSAEGDVGGLPAGALAQVVANAVLSGL